MAQLLQNPLSVHKFPLPVRIAAFSSAKTLQWPTQKLRQKLQNNRISAMLEIDQSPLISESEIAINDNNNGSASGVIVKKSVAMAPGVMEVDSLTEADLKKHGLRHTRRTKLVCTIGPACCGLEQLEALAVGGMNVARINMCHGTRDWHRTVIRNVRKLNAVKGYAVVIMMDTEGSETYMGDLRGAASVKAEGGDPAIYLMKYRSLRSCRSSGPLVNCRGEEKKYTDSVRETSHCEQKMSACWFAAVVGSIYIINEVGMFLLCTVISTMRDFPRHFVL